MKYKNMFSLVFVAILGFGLSGCGGGSTSTGAAGGGSGTRAANLIVRVNNTGTASIHTESQNRLASAISDLLARKAYAELAGNEVCVIGTDGEFQDVNVCGMTDDSGQVSLSVPPGSDYQVCVNGTESEDCADLGMAVSEGDVVLATVEDDDAQVTLASAVVQNAPAPTEEPEPTVPTIADFPDPAHPDKKVIICHKPDGNNPHTISVATQAAENAHLNHGDTPGPCEPESTANNDGLDDGENEGDES